MPKTGAIPQTMRAPGAGRGKARGHPKGRQVEARAAEEIAALLGDAPRRREYLIEYLHRVQDRYNFISAAHMAALAQHMRMAMAEVYEVATFYAHWDVVKEGEAPPPPLTVRVCDSLSCEMAGAAGLLTELEKSAGAGFRVVRGPCMGRCEGAPVVCVGHNHISRCSADDARAAIREGAIHEPIAPYTGYDDYLGGGGYALLRACHGGTRRPEDIIAVLDESGLRGLGGAGFPAGRKWSFVRAEPTPRLMAVNADEGEPGTFKDRHYLETDPHRFLEGMLIGAWAVEAAAVYVYLRDEYPAIREMLTGEIARIGAAGLCAGTEIHLRRGAGAYICGEESAMLESIEGKRGMPRHKPPFPSQVGLFGRPTLINNVETLYWVRDIVERGPEWFAEQGRDGHKGPRSFSVSGRVKEPGVKLAPAGITVRALIEEHCGGMAEGHTFKAYLPGGASGGILPASLGEVPLDFGTLEAHGSFIGSAAVVVLSDHDDMRLSALNLMRFFADESCGQCTPCRVGTEKAVALMRARNWDIGLLEELGQCMTDASICGLGQAAPNPLRHVIQHFPEEVS